jgi:hypothetical protein
VASRFTPAARTTILERTRAGDSLARAAAAAGVSINTAKRWIKTGGLFPDGPYGEFRRELDQARGSAAELSPASDKPMSDNEIREHLEAAIRRGSVGAVATWLRHFREPPPDPEPAEPLSAIMRLVDSAGSLPVRVPDDAAELAKPRARAIDHRRGGVDPATGITRTTPPAA